jgi:hypothetical protein
MEKCLCNTARMRSSEVSDALEMAKIDPFRGPPVQDRVNARSFALQPDRGLWVCRLGVSKRKFWLKSVQPLTDAPPVRPG